MSVPGPAVPHQPPHRAPLPQQPAAPRRTSLVGPVVLTVTGVVLLVGALVMTVLTAGGFVRLVDSGVLTLAGEPGPAVLASTAAPGATQVELEAGERYAVHLVVPQAYGDDEQRLRDAPDLILQAPSGEVVVADGSPGVNQRQGVGDQVAVSVAAFTAPETGTYGVAVPDPDVPGAWVALTPDREFLPFFRGIWSSVLGVFGIIVLSILGFSVLAGGVVWWVLRARARRAPCGPGPAGPAPAGPGPAGPAPAR